MTATDILHEQDPAKLLGSDRVAGFRKLAREWHPDRCRDPRAAEVMAHLLRLRDIADGGDIEETVVPGGKLVWRLDTVELRATGAEHAVPILSRLAAAHDNLKKRLPTVISSSAGCLMLQRPPGAVPLDHVLRRYQDGVPPEHVAWMGSRLFELVAHLSNWADTGHFGLLPSTLMVLPEPHGLVSLDWRFAHQLGGKLSLVPGELRDLVPADKRTQPGIDLAAVHRVCLILLGDSSGIGNILLRRTSVPRPLLDWLRATPVADPVEHFKSYRHMLERVFGAPKYHKLEL